MKISTPCMQCFIETNHPGAFITGDYYDDLTVNIKCEKGHNSSVMLQSQKFEVLLESAANALLDDYTIEAASAFSSAYERFLEFCIRVLCDKRGVGKSEFKETFKQMSERSERQLGAFLFLHLLEFGKSYKLRNKEITKFRNKIIHNGYIPSPEEVKKFARHIYSEIYIITKLLRTTCAQNIQNITSEYLKERSSNIGSDVNKTVSTGTMFFSLVNMDQKDNFDEAFKSYKTNKEFTLALAGIKSIEPIPRRVTER